MRRIAANLTFIVAACFVGILALRSCGTPPSEQSLIEDFYAHRSEHELLHDMLLADKQVIRIASWGVETTTSPVPQIPPAGDFPVDRYKEYLKALTAVGGIVAIRGEGAHADTYVGMWAFGWAGDTRHVSVCWKENVPTNLASSLDDYHNDKEHKQPHGVYRHIDGNWYLWADW